MGRSGEVTDFDHATDAQLVELFGLDTEDELYTNVMGGKAFIVVCDGMWVKAYEATKWEFRSMEHVFP
ncbi:hypothetical protein N8D56_21420 [Devosia sp. A8/3-2]|nr:hypothetical protein N8D56_21420 [Devosia sp. A8/3-2]